MILPLLWAAAAFAVWLISRPVATPVQGVAAERIYISAPYHGMPFSSALAGLAVAYFALEALRGVRYRRALGYAHLGLTSLGAALIFAPQFMLPFSPASDNPLDTLYFWSRIASVGYVMTLVGIGLFALLLADSVRLSRDNPSKT